MGNTLYLECCSGISGDMAVAALLDLGADQTALNHTLKSLPVEGFSVNICRVKKSGLDVCDFNVILEHDNHDHDMEYLHPKESPAHTHTAAAHPEHDAHCSHRNLYDILSIIEQADMTESARETAAKIFHILAKAEAKAHGTPLENVHFHEVGAVDSIVDVISAAVCLDNLNITGVIIPLLYEGTGTIRCQHGILPVPVPAVTNILQTCQIPVQITETQGELITPTGAAIAAATCTDIHLPESFRIIRSGLGAGKRTYNRPGILRAMLIEPFHSSIWTDQEKICKLETNIDDCSGEVLGYVLECLMQAGARDVHYFPVYMKKNRPAYQLNVLCETADASKMEQIIFTQTTTIGIRKQYMDRSILPRQIQKIQTCYGEIQVKICSVNGEKRMYPEYDSIVEVCRQTGSPYMEIYRNLQDICRKQCL